METRAGSNVARRHQLRWWMILVCLVASWLCWWGVDQWLEPRPLWSRALPDDQYYHPIGEDPAGKRVAALVKKLSRIKGTAPATVALAILDQQDGRELHRTDLKEKTSFFDGEEFSVPRFHGDVVWFMARDTGFYSLQYRLCSWNLKTGQLHEKIQYWQQYPAILYVKWPVSSRVFVVRHALPVQLMYFYCWPDPLKALLLQQLSSQALLTMPLWYESYQLADEAGQPPKLLARWTPPSSYWNGGVEVSPDGQWTLFPEPWGDARLAYQRALTTGRTAFKGQELFDLFRSKERGVLVYETATGRLLQRFQDQSAIHGINGWRGREMALSTYRPRVDFQLSLEELRKGAEDWNRNLYARSFMLEYRFLRIEQGQLKSLQVTAENPLGNVPLSFLNNTLNAVHQTERERTYYEFDFENDQLLVKRSVIIPQNSRRNFYRWVPDSSQYLVLSLPLFQQYRGYFQGNWAWLNPVIDWLINVSRKEYDLVVVDQLPGGAREHTFQQSPVLTLATFSQLYLLDVKKNGEQLVSIILNAYPLPLPISSPWWSRGAAVLPIMVLVSWMMLRTRRQPA